MNKKRGDMKSLGKRQRKNRSRARVNRARTDAKRSEVEHDQPFHSAPFSGVAFHASDDGPCNCFGDSVRWIALPFTRATTLGHLMQLNGGREGWNE